MKRKYIIEGMTCGSCKAKVEDSLNSLSEISSVVLDLEDKTATITTTDPLDISILQASLPAKYTIKYSSDSITTVMKSELATKSKLQQLKPLFLILAYISTAAILMHRSDANIREMMTDFMGLFFIVFSFFKMLDLKGFASTFSMYDPIAERLPLYGLVYPFIETALGLMLLLRYQVQIALVLTIIVLGFTTYGVVKTLLSKRTIKCACLGTALDLPMTEATFIENALMITMSFAMLALM